MLPMADTDRTPAADVSGRPFRTSGPCASSRVRCLRRIAASLRSQHSAGTGELASHGRWGAGCRAPQKSYPALRSNRSRIAPTARPAGRRKSPRRCRRRLARWSLIGQCSIVRALGAILDAFPATPACLVACKYTTADAAANATNSSGPPTDATDTDLLVRGASAGKMKRSRAARSAVTRSYSPFGGCIAGRLTEAARSSRMNAIAERQSGQRDRCFVMRSFRLVKLTVCITLERDVSGMRGKQGRHFHATSRKW